MKRSIISGSGARLLLSFLLLSQSYTSYAAPPPPSITDTPKPGANLAALDVRAPAAAPTPAPALHPSVEVAQPVSISILTVTATAAAPIAGVTVGPEQPNNSAQANSGSGSGDGAGGDSKAGGSGSDNGSFTLSKGALAAIIAAVAIVAIIGIASAVLYYLAKKKNWEVRRSIRRASRRLTGRPVDGGRRNRPTTTGNRQRVSGRPAAVRLGSPPRRPNAAATAARRHAGMDLEKSSHSTNITANPVAEEKSETEGKSNFEPDTPTPRGKKWRTRLFSYHGKK